MLVAECPDWPTAVQGTEDEPVFWIPVDCLPSRCISNIPWIVQLARNVLHGGVYDEVTEARIEYAFPERT